MVSLYQTTCLWGIASRRNISVRTKEEYMDYKGMKELELDWMRDTIPRAETFNNQNYKLIPRLEDPRST
jgi:hypothetical protein